MNKLVLSLNYDGRNLETIIKIDGGDLTKFVDDCLTAFDSGLRNIISINKFEKSFEDCDEGQRSIVDDTIEALK